MQYLKKFLLESLCSNSPSIEIDESNDEMHRCLANNIEFLRNSRALGESDEPEGKSV